MVLVHPMRTAREIGIGVGGVRCLQTLNVAAASAVVGLCFGYAQSRFLVLEPGVGAIEFRDAGGWVGRGSSS